MTTAGELAVADSTRASDIDRVLSAIAGQVIDAVDRRTLSLNRVCSRPDCNLFTSAITTAAAAATRFAQMRTDKRGTTPVWADV